MNSSEKGGVCLTKIAQRSPTTSGRGASGAASPSGAMKFERRCLMVASFTTDVSRRRHGKPTSFASFEAKGGDPRSNRGVIATAAAVKYDPPKVGKAEKCLAVHFKNRPYYFIQVVLFTVMC